MNSTALATQAVLAATRLRSQQGIGPSVGICPYDLAIALEIKVHFMSAPSLEGMYSPEPKPLIALGSERPAGRRRYSCAHEIGHHVFKHGFRLDELSDSNSAPWSPEEFLAQRFSSALLMPKLAVDSAFARRGWTSSTARPDQIYVVAQELGVGFTTLITNMEINLNALSKTRADELHQTSLAAIREDLAGSAVAHDVFIVDKFWIRPKIDVEVGDIIIFPASAEIQGVCASREAGSDRRFTATAPGTAPVTLAGSSSSPMLRVSKRNFEGLARYRHLEETK